MSCADIFVHTVMHKNALAYARLCIDGCTNVQSVMHKRMQVDN